MSTPPFTEAVTADVLRVPIAFVNAYAVGAPGTPWVLFDTGLAGAADYPQRTTEKHQGGPPAAIVLTHGHFDHAGNAAALAEAWDVPIYAHPLELPFLTGGSDYAPGDPSMGGAIAQLSRVFPSAGYDFGERVRALPADGTVPHLAGWRWLHTPGHTTGHISLWRASDAVLLAGDALATMDLDSWLTQMTHERELSRAPVPFTPNWDAAEASVARLAALRPRVLAAGHGRAMSKPYLAKQLERYAEQPQRPTYGRYTTESAQYSPETGLTSVPPPVADRSLPWLIGGIAAVGLVLAAGIALPQKRDHRRR